VDREGWVALYESLEGALGNIEVYDVEHLEFDVFDGDGRRLVLGVSGNEPGHALVRSVQVGASHREALLAALVNALREHAGLDSAHLSCLDLSELRQLAMSNRSGRWIGRS
jgi:hypothetical protein